MQGTKIWGCKLRRLFNKSIKIHASAEKKVDLTFPLYPLQDQEFRDFLMAIKAHPSLTLIALEFYCRNLTDSSRSLLLDLLKSRPNQLKEIFISDMSKGFISELFNILSTYSNDWRSRSMAGKKSPIELDF